MNPSALIVARDCIAVANFKIVIKIQVRIREKNFKKKCLCTKIIITLQDTQRNKS